MHDSLGMRLDYRLIIRSSIDREPIGYRVGEDLAMHQGGIKPGFNNGFVMFLIRGQKWKSPISKHKERGQGVMR